ncbi:MAG: hypothetical protein R2705_02915 [Ilumatobacteraceae bacterium]
MSTSFIDVEDDLTPVPCRWAESAELDALCAVLGERGRMLQVVHEFFDAGLTCTRIEQLGDLSRRHGIPTTLSPLFHSGSNPGAVHQVMEAVEREVATGARVWPQVQTRPIDISWTMDQRSLMFLVIPGWWSVLSLPDKDAKLAALTDPSSRAQLIAGLEAVGSAPGSTVKAENFVIRDVVLDRNRHLVGRTLADAAAERGCTAAEALLDLAVEEDLGTWFVRSDIGHVEAGPVGELLAHPLVHIGASDAGAHVGSFATYGDTGLLFSKFVREHSALTLEGRSEADRRRQRHLGARRPRSAAQRRPADVVVFDPETIDRGPEVASEDFPGDGHRWIRRSVGVEHVVVNGTETWNATDGYVPDARSGAVATR